MAETDAQTVATPAADTAPAAKKPTRKRRTRAKKGAADKTKKEAPIASFMVSTQDVDPARLPPVPEGDDVAAERRVRLLDALAAIDPDDPDAPGDPVPLGLYILGCLDDELDGCDVILHDRDLADPIWSPSKGDYLPPTHKAPHVHFLGHFDPSKKLTVPAIAARLGVPANLVEKPKAGRYGFDNLLAYMVHAKDAAKYQYAPTDVHTLRGEPYTDLYNRRRYAWERGRATKTARSTRELLPWLLAEVRAGRINQQELLLTPEYYDTYALHMPDFDRALDAYAKQRMANAVQALESGAFRKTIIFAHGPAGTGKSLWVSGVCRWAQDAYGWDVCRVVSGHVMDDYLGEEVLVFDDVGSSSLELDDWLRLLDPVNAARAAARYHNKPPLAPRVIIIATNVRPADFFGRLLPTHSEAGLFSAALRRISAEINVADPRVVGAYNATVGEATNDPDGDRTRYDRIELTGRDGTPHVTLTAMSGWYCPAYAYYTAPGAGHAAADLIARRNHDRDPAVPAAHAVDYVKAALAPAIKDGALPLFDYDGAASWVRPADGIAAWYDDVCVDPRRAAYDYIVNDRVPRYGLPGTPDMPAAPDDPLPAIAPKPALPAPDSVHETDEDDTPVADPRPARPFAV